MDPLLIAWSALMSVLGSAMGLFSGLTPGIHVNTLAAILVSSFASIAAFIGGFVPEAWVPVLVSCCIMSAGVVHSFVDFVPSVFLGAPDSEDAVSVLPGHRLLLEGRGQEAVSAAAIGSLVGCSAAIMLAIPLQYILINGGDGLVDSLTPAVLSIATAILVLAEFRRGAREGFATAAIMMVSGGLGYAVMTQPIPSAGILGEGTLMFPMLTGLFGMPPLLSSQRGGRTPKQKEGRKDPVGPIPGLKGVITGCIAGWFPGITSTVGASMAAAFLPEGRPERFIATVASIGTVTSVLALVTMSATGKGRTGIALAIGDVMGDSLGGFMSEGFMLLLLSAAIAAALGYKMTIVSGGKMASALSGRDASKINKLVAVAVSALVLMMTGPFGIAVLVISTAIGYLPLMFGTSRVVLCGCLLVPVLIMELIRARLRLTSGGVL